MDKSILLSGYFGFDNGGDEAVLSAVVKMLRDILPDVPLIALSGDPDKTVKSNREYDLKAIDRRNIKAIKNELQHAALLISGGGSLFQDVTSVRSVYYYASILNLAHKAGVPAVILAQGLGPLNSFFGKRMTRKSMSKCEFISWRDPDSLNLAVRIGLPQEKMLLTCDPVLNWNPDYAVKSSEGKRVVVAVRPWQNFAQKEIVKAAAELLAEDYDVILLPFQKGVDEDLAAEMNAALDNRCKVPVYSGPLQLFGEIASADFLVGMRLHSLIMAKGAGTHCAAISYDPKIDSFAKREEITVLGTAENIKSGDIVSAVKQGCNFRTEKKDYSEDWREVLARISEIYHRA
ncbi:MAG: polysaccharide pyruvyl transferase CsaB [Bacillota bacterium]|jgi:polysaccharide pyruvyl transferase CsaB